MHIAIIHIQNLVKRASMSALNNRFTYSISFLDIFFYIFYYTFLKNKI